MMRNSLKIVPCDTNIDNSDKVKQKVQILYQWLVDNPNVNACTDYQNLEFFLRSCKYDVDRTKKKMKWWVLLSIVQRASVLCIIFHYRSTTKGAKCLESLQNKIK